MRLLKDYDLCYNVQLEIPGRAIIHSTRKAAKKKYGQTTPIKVLTYEKYDISIVIYACNFDDSVVKYE